LDAAVEAERQRVGRFFRVHAGAFRQLEQKAREGRLHGRLHPSRQDYLRPVFAGTRA